MITDKDLLFSKEQAITATAASTSYVDLGVARDVGAGEPLELFLRSTAAFNTLTSLTVALQADDAADFSGAVTLWSTSIVLASLTAGNAHPVPPIPAGTTKRYLRLLYTVVGSDPTTGALSAGIVLDKPANVVTTY